MRSTAAMNPSSSSLSADADVRVSSNESSSGFSSSTSSNVLPNILRNSWSSIFCSLARKEIVETSASSESFCSISARCSSLSPFFSSTLTAMLDWSVSATFIAATIR